MSQLDSDPIPEPRQKLNEPRQREIWEPFLNAVDSTDPYHTMMMDQDVASPPRTIYIAHQVPAPVVRHQTYRARDQNEYDREFNQHIPHQSLMPHHHHQQQQIQSQSQSEFTSNSEFSFFGGSLGKDCMFFVCCKEMLFHFNGFTSNVTTNNSQRNASVSKDFVLILNKSRLQKNLYTLVSWYEAKYLPDKPIVANVASAAKALLKILDKLLELIASQQSSISWPNFEREYLRVSRQDPNWTSFPTLLENIIKGYESEKDCVTTVAKNPKRTAELKQKFNE